MQAIRLTQKLDSTTLRLPQLGSLLGQEVEIIILANESASPEKTEDKNASLLGSVLQYDDPFGPACDADDWGANQ